MSLGGVLFQKQLKAVPPTLYYGSVIKLKHLNSSSYVASDGVITYTQSANGSAQSCVGKPAVYGLTIADNSCYWIVKGSHGSDRWNAVQGNMAPINSIIRLENLMTGRNLSSNKTFNAPISASSGSHSFYAVIINGANGIGSNDDDWKILTGDNNADAIRLQYNNDTKYWLHPWSGAKLSNPSGAVEVALSNWGTAESDTNNNFTIEVVYPALNTAVDSMLNLVVGSATQQDLTNAKVILNAAGDYKTTDVASKIAAINTEQSRRGTSGSAVAPAPAATQASVAPVVAPAVQAQAPAVEPLVTPTDQSIEPVVAPLVATAQAPTTTVDAALNLVISIATNDELVAAIEQLRNEQKHRNLAPINLPLNFKTESGKALEITVGSKDGELVVCCIDLNGFPWFYDNYSTAALPWEKQAAVDTLGKALLFKDIAASSDGYLAAISNDGKAYSYDWAKKNWVIINPGTNNAAVTFTSITAGSDDEVWALGNDQVPYELTPSGWVAHKLSPSAISISAGYDGTVIGINAFGAVFKYNDAAKKQADEWVSIPGIELESVAVCSKDNIFGLTSYNKLWQYNGKIWTAVLGQDGQPATGFHKLAVNAGGTAFALDADGDIYQKGNAGVVIIPPTEAEKQKEVAAAKAKKLPATTAKKVKKKLAKVKAKAPAKKPTTRAAAVKAGKVKPPKVKKNVTKKPKKKVQKKKVVKKTVKKSAPKKTTKKVVKKSAKKSKVKKPASVK